MPTALSPTEQPRPRSQHVTHWSVATQPRHDRPGRPRKKSKCGPCFQHTTPTWLFRNSRTSLHKHRQRTCRQADHHTLQSHTYPMPTPRQEVPWLLSRRRKHSSPLHIYWTISGRLPMGKKSPRFRSIPSRCIEQHWRILPLPLERRPLFRSTVWRRRTLLAKMLLYRVLSTSS